MCWMKDYIRDRTIMVELGCMGGGAFVLHSVLEIVDQDGNDEAFREILTTVCCQRSGIFMAMFYS